MSARRPFPLIPDRHHGLIHVLLLVAAALGLVGAALKGSWILGAFFLALACLAVAQISRGRQRDS